MIKDEWKCCVGNIFQRRLIHFVRSRIVLNFIAADSGPQAVDILQIGFHICSPLAFREACTGSIELNACRGIDYKTGPALVKWLAKLVTECIASNAHIIDLMEIVKLQTGHRLLFGCLIEVGHLLTGKTEVFHKN